MKIEIIPCLNDNYSYKIFDKETDTNLIIDPSDFNVCDAVMETLNSKKSIMQKFWALRVIKIGYQALIFF